MHTARARKTQDFPVRAKPARHINILIPGVKRKPFIHANITRAYGGHTKGHVAAVAVENLGHRRSIHRTGIACEQRRALLQIIARRIGAIGDHRAGRDHHFRVVLEAAFQHGKKGAVAEEIIIQEQHNIAAPRFIQDTVALVRQAGGCGDELHARDRFTAGDIIC